MDTRGKPYTDNVKRKLDFLAAHPEWSIAYDRDAQRYLADGPDNRITDQDLGRLLNRVERATPASEATSQ